MSELIPTTIEEMEIARKASRRKREEAKRRQAAVEEAMRQEMLAFCRDKTLQARVRGCSENELWRMIFVYVYGTKPRDTYTKEERRAQMWQQVQKRLFFWRKVPAQVSLPPSGSTDPLWDDLFHTRKALAAYRWAQKQMLKSSESPTETEIRSTEIRTA
jgi:hypothetical protein